MPLALISKIKRRFSLPYGPKRSALSLTEGSMMEPEASVGAIVFHHPDCIYFDVAK